LGIPALSEGSFVGVAFSEIVIPQTEEFLVVGWNQLGDGFGAGEERILVKKFDESQSRILTQG
jgi:hypothetical protein